MQKTRRYFWVLLVVLGLGLSSGCGFHLRGSAALPPELGPVLVQGGDGRLAGEIRDALRRQGVSLTADAGQARTQVRLLHDEAGRRVLSVGVGVGGRVREYELYHSVEYEILARDRATKIGPETITVLRDYSFDETQVLGAASEEEILRRDMRQELVGRILRRLSAVAS